jgi:hypothetical protein
MEFPNRVSTRGPDKGVPLMGAHKGHSKGGPGKGIPKVVKARWCPKAGVHYGGSAKVTSTRGAHKGVPKRGFHKGRSRMVGPQIAVYEVRSPKGFP